MVVCGDDLGQAGMGYDERTRRVYLRNGPRRALDGTCHDNAAYAFHRRLPGYAPTPLRAAPQAAQALGIGQLWVKHERSRFGLPAFKVLGAAWATYRALAEQIGSEPATWATLDDLAAWAAPLRPLTLVAATDGNHGRAVARMAALLGFGARIYVPDDMTAARRAAIASEGAEVVVVHGTYDDAVARSADDAGPHCMVISDTTWPGYEQVPGWVIEGYGTILWELEDQFAALGVAPPRVVAVQIGVGALAAAVTRHYRRPELVEVPALLGVEPLLAAGMLASLHAGRMVSVPGPHTSIMAGLNCGAPSTLAWPVLSAGLDALVAVEDERAREAMRLLAADGIEAGETGAAGVAGLLEAAHGAYAAELQSALGLTAETTALAIVTEGATDPAAYAEIVGRAAG